MKRLLSSLALVLFVNTHFLLAQNYCIPSSNCFYAPILTVVTSGAVTNLNLPNNGCSANSYVLHQDMFVGVPSDTITFTIGLAGLLQTGIIIWADWNNDGDFADAGESIFSTTTSSTSATGTMYVPSSVSIGVKRVRIRTNYYSIPTDPCVSQFYGETEDFNLTIVKPGGTDLALTSIDSPIVFRTGANTIWIKYSNLSTNTITKFDAGFKLDNSTPVTLTNITTSLAPGETKSYKFTTSLNVSTSGSHQLKVWVANPNGTGADSDPTNDTILKGICTGISGTYTIGTNGDFQTFGAAVAAMQNCGISGPVTFNILPGTYNGRVVIPDISGMSSTNTVTFDGQDVTKVSLSYAGVSSSDRATVVLNGCSYVTFRRMKIINTGTSYELGVYIGNNSHHNTIRECSIVVGNYSSSTVAGILLAFDENGSSGQNMNINNNLIYQNSITGGHTGVRLSGGASSLGYYNKVIGNNFSEHYYAAILQSGMVRTTIQYNNITNMKSAQAVGIMSDYYCGGTVIDGNIINPGRCGISLNAENAAISDSSFIINNMIYNFSNSALQQGIYSYYDLMLRIYNNSIVVNGTNDDSVSSAICLFYTRGSEIFNNILVSSNKNLLVSMTVLSYTILPQLDFNLYYYVGTTNRKFFINNKSYLNLTGFKTDNTYFAVPHDKYSYDQKNPNFISSANLHLVSTQPPYIGKKTWLSKDVDGDLRCPYAGFLGADEPTYQGIKPTAGFITQDTICNESPVAFFNKYTALDPVSHAWYINGVYDTNSLNLVHVFPKNMTSATIMLISTNCYGSDTFTHTVYIRAPLSKPVPAFLSDKNIISPFDEVNFFDASTGCPSEWEWKIFPETFNDPYLGNIPTFYFINFTDRYSQNPIIRFEVAGAYDVRLIVKNSKGVDSVRVNKYIIVKPLQYMCQYVLPEVAISPFGLLTDDSGPQGDYSNNLNCTLQLTPCVDTLTFTFYEFELSSGDYLKVYDGTGSQGTPLWDFNTYGANGLTGSLSSSTFPKTLTATSGRMFFQFTTNANGTNKGFLGEWFGTQSQVSKPAAYFTGPDSGCVGVEIAFQNLSTGSDLIYEWDFEGTGIAQSTAKDGLHTFNSSGVYPVKLKVKNCGGDSVFVKNIVIISPTTVPQADFIADNVKPRKSIDEVLFTNLTKGCANSFKWDINPSSFTPVSDYPNGNNPKIIFNETTCYTITLIASYGSSKDTFTRTCYVYPIDYCIPVVNNLNSDIGINRVQIGTINCSSSSGSKAYSDYSKDYYTYLDKYAKHVITISRNTNLNAMTRKVWIDWNIDGDFNDQGEEVLYQPSGTSLSYTDTIRVPGYAQTGPTKMRIGVCISGFPNLPCGTNLIGEFEDYKVIIRNYSLAPVVTLIGNDTVSVEQCSLFNDPGATAVSNLFGNMTSQILKTDNVDWTSPGTYQINYAVRDSFGNHGQATRTVIITPEKHAPYLKLLGNNPDTIDVGDTYFDPGFLTYDSCSGIYDTIINNMLKNKFLGKYQIQYQVMDMAGNIASVLRDVYVIDRIPPAINLIGKSVDSVRVFTTWSDPGASATDNYDKKLSITISGNVDVAKTGTYVLKYSVSDSCGNGPVSVSRVVVVYDDIRPQFTALYNDQDTVIVDVDHAIPWLKVKATDNYDPSVNIDSAGSYYQAFPDGIARQLGFYTLFYYCSDKAGNQAYLNFTIQVVDRIKPVIKLKGASILNVCRYKTADTSDLLFDVTDNYDKNPSAWVTGTYYKEYLPKRYVGLFNIVYHAKDASGNVADSVIRYVNVYECGSISEENRQLNISLYPNPNNGKFYILSEENIISAEVFNAIGQKVMITDKHFVQGNQLYMEIPSARQGIYLVRVDTERGSRIFKINIF